MKIEDVINREELRDRLDGDYDLLKELIDIFLTDSVKIMDDIKKAIDTNEAEKTAKLAHTIKGAVSNFSARNAFDAAFNLEKIGKNREMEKAQPAYEKLKIEISNTCEAMKLLMEKNSF